MLHKKYLYTALFLSLAVFLRVHGQDQTVGLIQNTENAYDGYTLFASLQYPATYLINNEGQIVHSWEHDYVAGNAIYLLENGNLFRSVDPMTATHFIMGGDGGLIEIVDWDGNPVWQYEYSNEMVRHHHEALYLPNGNVLILAWEYKSREEAIQAGRDSTTMDEDSLWPEHLVEVKPNGSSGGDIVWKWHIWDHLIQDYDPSKDNYGVVEDHPELIDINYFKNYLADWQHANAIDYNESLDQILISSRDFDEIWIIDHSTTTEEAAGHSGGLSGKGGDILYRYGNPRTYRAGTKEDQVFFSQHNVHWIPEGLEGAGHLLAFNNGPLRPEPRFSSIDELVLPMDGSGNYIDPEPGSAYGPDEFVWRYIADPPESFYSTFLSGAQRLPNGNTLICSGAFGTFFEINRENEIVWEYISPVTVDGPVEQGVELEERDNIVFRAKRYGKDYPAFIGRDLTPKGTIELTNTAVPDNNDISGYSFQLYANYPNPFNPVTTIQFSLPRASKVDLNIYNALGQNVLTLINQESFSAGNHTIEFNADDLNSGLYVYRLQADNYSESRSMILTK